MYTFSDSYRVYLHKLDINEDGSSRALDNLQLERYLISFAMVFDRVILQTSAFFKRRDLYIQLKLNPYLFTIPYHGHPIISPYRGIGEENFSAYLDSRYSILSLGSLYNSEYLTYRENNAPTIAKELDQIFNLGTLPMAQQNTDMVFRKLSSSQNGNAILLPLPNYKKICNELHNYAKNEQMFQTFHLIEKLQHKSNLSTPGALLLGKQLRQNYFQANAQVNSCLPLNDIHIKYANIQKFLKITAMHMITESSSTLSSINAVVNIKETDCYKRLQHFYFCSSEEDIEQLYCLYTTRTHEKNFFKSREVRQFFYERALEYESYKQAFEQMYKLCELFEKSRKIK